MIALIFLAFLLGYFLAKSGRLYLFTGGKLSEPDGATTYYPWLGVVNGLDVNLVGIDLTEHGAVPVYRPTLAFEIHNKVLTIGLRTGDLSEATILLSYRFPFIKFNYQRNVHEAGNSNE